MLVRKNIKLDDVHLKMDGEAGTFEGYAARFGGVDSYGDTILQGAFASTLRQNGKPKMCFAHEWDMPIGRYEKVSEDDSGLYVKGSFTPGHAKAADVRAAMLHGTVDGLSIGGFVKKGDAEDKPDGGQIITKFSRLVEISVVTFPADAGARIDMATVRGEDVADVIGEIETERDFERLLRDAGGFSRGQAVAIAARMKAIYASGEPMQKDAESELFERIKRLAAALD